MVVDLLNIEPMRLPTTESLLDFRLKATISHTDSSAVAAYVVVDSGSVGWGFSSDSNSF